MGDWETKAKFKVGDVVRLRSGGPPMTIKMVESPAPDGCIYYEVQWFVDDLLHREDLAEPQLLIWVSDD